MAKDEVILSPGRGNGEDTASVLRLHLLGGLNIEWSTKPISLESRKHQALLTYLAVTGAPQSRDRLAGLFWGDWPEARARRYLSRALWDIGRCIPSVPPPLIAEARTVAFNHQCPYWLDIEEFERLSSQADIGNLRSAVALYGGDFMEGFFLDDCPEFEMWMLVQRARLHELATEILARLIAHYMARGSEGYTAGISYARRLLELDPWREETHRQLMLLLALSGQRSAALAQYRECCRLLAKELGLKPTEDTVALYERLCSPLASTPPSPYSVPTLPLPFTGRGSEHAYLLQCWQEALQGKGKLTLLEGEAGAGKTRLAEEVLRYVEEHGTLVLQGRCHEFQSPMAYQPFISALRAGLPHLQALFPKLDKFWLVELSRLLPELHIMYPDLPEAATVSEEITQQRLFEAIARVILLPRALVLFIDDLHWADPATVDLLRYLLYRLADVPVWFLGAYRQEEMELSHPLMLLRRDLGREGRVALLHLENLPDEMVLEMVRGLPGLAEPQAQMLAAYLSRKSEGNPFIITELLRDLAEQGLLTRHEDHWLVDDTWLKGVLDTFKSDQHIPFRVQEMIMGRVGRLPAQARSLLELASVIGEPFEQRLLDRVSDGASSQAHDALVVLLTRGLVRPQASSDEPSYELSHPVVRQVLYHHLSEEVRGIYHGRVAVALEQLYQGREEQVVAVLAHHYAQSPYREKALGYLLRAGEQMQAGCAPQAAIEFYNLALALIAPEDRPARYQVLARRERLYNQTAQRDAQAEDLVALWALAVDEEQQAEVLCRQAEWAMRTARFAEGIAAAQRARELAGKNRALIARSLRLEAMCYLRRGHPGTARACCMEGLRLCQEMGDRREEALCLGTLGICELDLGNLEQARQHMESALGFWSELDDPWRVATTCNNLSMLYHRLGDYGRALEVQKRARELMPRAGDPALDAYSLTSLGILYSTIGRYEEALACYKEAVKLAHFVADRRIEGYALLRWGETLYALGKVNEAEEMFLNTLRIQDEQGIVSNRMEVLEGLAQCSLARGDVRQALALLEEAEPIYAETGVGGVSFTLALKARTHLLLEEEEAARQVMERFRAIAEGGQEQLEPEVWWVASQAWRELGEETAARLALEQAYLEVQRRAASLEDEADRQRYLLSIAAHLAILQAWESTFAME